MLIWWLGDEELLQKSKQIGKQKMNKYDHVTSNNCCSSEDIIKWGEQKPGSGKWHAQQV